MISVTKDIFFDRAAVTNRMDRKTQKVLSSTGAFSRTVMRRGMRRRKKISQPGQYPSAHAGQLKELIFFGFDEGTKSLIVGPTLFKSDRDVIGSSKTVPELVNEGGSVLRIQKLRRGARRTVHQRYRPRPFVDLTLPHAAAKLAENMEKFAF